MSESNKATVFRFHDEFNRGNPDGIRAIARPDAAIYHPPAPGPMSMDEGLQMATAFMAAFPDHHNTVEDVLAEGDRVVCRGTFTGTHTGDFMGVPPSGLAVSMPFIGIYRFDDEGKIAELRVEQDNLGLMQQLGAIPAPEPATA
jgi:steroid delta-isomerase-like uncharacterized protein